MRKSKSTHSSYREEKKIGSLPGSVGFHSSSATYYVTVPQCAHLYNRVITVAIWSHKKSKFNKVFRTMSGTRR